MAKTCTYCNSNSTKLTREHIFPYGLISKFPEANHAIFNGDRAVKLSAEKQVIKDVCQNCNNGPLSKLDTYGNDFIIKYFSKEIKPEQFLAINYNYDKLHRWVMKIMYNGLRNDSSSKWLKKNSKYIIGMEANSTSKFSLFLGNYVYLAPFANMFPSIPFQVCSNPQILLDAQRIDGDYKYYSNENVEMIYVLRLCNAIFVLICWKESCNPKENEKELIDILPHSLLSPQGHSTYISRSTSSFNTGHLFLLISKFTMRQHDLYMSSIRPVVK